MNKNILETSLTDYLLYHWRRNEKNVKFLNMTDAEFELIWTKNYYKEKCETLERKLSEIKNKEKNKN